MQKGELHRIKRSWFVRYYDGETRRMKKIGTIDDFPRKSDIASRFQQFMADVNETGRKPFEPSDGITLSVFVNSKYFPDAKKELRGSTLRGYIAIWKYVEPKLGHMRVRDIRTFDCQEAMDAIVEEHREFKKASLFRIKTFMSAVFSDAIRAGLRRDDHNPIVEVEVRGLTKQQKQRTETFAYSLDDIRRILGVLSEPERVLMAIAAFTALRRSEIIALRWDDYDGKVIWVRRGISFGRNGEMIVELPKTEASEAPVPVIAPLRMILEAWKAKAKVTKGCWIFQAAFTRKEHPADLLDAASLSPLSPANVLRVVLPALKKAEIEWHGFHAFRRGLATNLRTLGVDDLTISEILRHSDVSVTRESYIKRVGEKATAAMERFEQELVRAWSEPVSSGHESALVQ